jgi:TRAP-type C4-dicarboxylate transport system substrate-binding protein
MFKLLAQCALLSFALSPCAAIAEPIALKLAFFTSDQSKIYNIAVRPFVDAVNAHDSIKIETYPSGILGKDQAKQPQMVRDGVADIAFVVLGPTGNQFPDRSVMELPGLFNDMAEATLVCTRLIASGMMEGFSDFYVIGAFATDPESIHTRPPVATLGDLKGKRIRANNMLEAGVLAKLGMYPVVLPIGKTAEAISRGTIDGAATAPLAMVDFGVGRVATHHFMLSLGPTVIAILMNRKKLESLSKENQAVIRQYSGEWLAARIVEGYAPYNKEIVEQLKSDPAREVVFPSQADIDVAAIAFKAARMEWAETSPHNRQLLNAAEAELRQLRSTQ